MVRRLATAAVTLGAVSVYLGLAVLGWGGLAGARFGAQYDAYRARTWRLIPGLY